ncbi:Pseudouridine-5'-phosphatase-like [Homarus americanus]|uniref:pseudouridine 5'-phosphatase n=1 Tax=Homarus americanus TaxID=6706 RepID=A0A8J5JSZ1_HOMAM|nr:Pseudouridine-5'-phosphatase-like [Homarus americanus]
MGQTAENCARIIINTLQISLSVEDYIKQVTQIHHKIMPSAQLMPDTECLYTRAAEIVASEYGKTFTWEMQVACMGLKARADAKYNIDTLDLPLTVDQYLDKVSRVYKTVFPSAQFMPDTERLYTEATQIIASEYNKVYTWEIKVQCMGMKGAMAAQLIIDSLELPLTVDQYLKKIISQYDSLFPNANILPVETLSETERLYSAATQIVIGPYGKEYTWEIKWPLMGRVGIELAKGIVGALQVSLSPEEYLTQVEEQYKHLFPLAQLMPGAEKLVRHLHKHNIPIAIASGGAQDSFELKTTNHKEFVSLFSHVVLASTDPEVENGKPAPDVFLICAKRFPDSPNPDQCLVFEDAPNGVEAGVKAGMQVVMVPDPRLAQEKTKGSSQVLKSLEDFKPELFGLPTYDD